MKLAKPPDGFKVKVSSGPKALADQLGVRYPGFNDRWIGLKDRIKMVGHRLDEIPSSGPPGNFFLIEIEADDPNRCPELWVIYKIHGDTLTICEIKALS